MRILTNEQVPAFRVLSLQFKKESLNRELVVRDFQAAPEILPSCAQKAER